jgi:hypothetical protein
MSAVAAVRRDLAGLPRELAESGLAATALAMAQRLDAGGGSPSECAKALTDVLLKLRELAPPKQERTRLDDLSARRAARLAGRAKAAD